jgi:hypothetical protein
MSISSDDLLQLVIKQRDQEQLNRDIIEKLQVCLLYQAVKHQISHSISDTERKGGPRPGKCRNRQESGEIRRFEKRPGSTLSATGTAGVSTKHRVREKL